MSEKTQLGLRLDAWHLEKLKQIDPASSPTTIATELLSLAIELASGESPPANYLERVRINWHQLKTTTHTEAAQ